MWQSGAIWADRRQPESQTAAALQLHVGARTMRQWARSKNVDEVRNLTREVSSISTAQGSFEDPIR